jgi:hypothetical protein
MHRSNYYDLVNISNYNIKLGEEAVLFTSKQQYDVSENLIGEKHPIFIHKIV